MNLYNNFVFAIRMQDGWNALHLVAQEGKADVARILIEAQAKINLQTKVYTIFKQLAKG